MNNTISEGITIPQIWNLLFFFSYSSWVWVCWWRIGVTVNNKSKKEMLNTKRKPPKKSTNSIKKVWKEKKYCNQSKWIIMKIKSKHKYYTEIVEYMVIEANNKIFFSYGNCSDVFTTKKCFFCYYLAFFLVLLMQFHFFFL